MAASCSPAVTQRLEYTTWVEASKLALTNNVPINNSPYPVHDAISNAPESSINNVLSSFYVTILILTFSFPEHPQI